VEVLDENAVIATARTASMPRSREADPSATAPGYRRNVRFQ
jgi:hypothetical protein